MHHDTYPDTHHDVSSNTIFGFWVYIMTDCVMFATFFATYAVLQNATFGGPSAKEILSLPYALIETLVLLASSFTCGLAMLGVLTKNQWRILTYLAATFLLGALFMYLELGEFQRILSQGHSWTQSAFLSAYFTLIGVHGLHILVGLLLLLFFGCQLAKRGLTAMMLRRLSCLKIYWHFLYLIWIFTFSIVYLIGAK